MMMMLVRFKKLMSKYIFQSIKTLDNTLPPSTLMLMSFDYLLRWFVDSYVLGPQGIFISRREN